MGHSWKNGLDLEEWNTLGKYVTVEKMGHTLNKGSFFEIRAKLRKRFRLGKVGQTCKTDQTWKKSRTYKNGSHLEKWVTF